MQNIDEFWLISKKINPNSGIYPSFQALRIALFDEFYAFEFYQHVILRFKEAEPFNHILESEKRHIDSLVYLCHKYGVPIPHNSWINSITIPNSLLECSEIAVARELENIMMYDYLLNFIPEPDIRDSFYKKQAASFNHHLPAFRKAVRKYDSSEFFSQELQESIKKLLNNKELDKSALEMLLKHLDKDFLTGALGGAIISFLLNLSQTKEE